MRNRRIVVAEIPDGPLEARHFREDEAPMPVPEPGEVLCRTLYASIDPVNRMSMAARTYRGGLGVGDVMAAFTLSELRGRHDRVLSGRLAGVGGVAGVRGGADRGPRAAVAPPRACWASTG